MVDLQKILKGSGLTRSFFPSAVYTVPIKDNTEFVTKFNKGTFKGFVKKTTKTVIVDQDPEPGEIIPAGAPINVTLTIKDVIPVGSFTDINAAVVNKYSNIGDLQADLEKPDDTVAKDAKAVLDRDEDYKSLSSLDKQVVDRFMEDRFGEQAVDIKEKIYSNMKFLHQL